MLFEFIPLLKKSCVSHWSTKLCIAQGDCVVFFSTTMQAGWDTSGRWNHGQLLAALTETQQIGTQRDPRGFMVQQLTLCWGSCGVSSQCAPYWLRERVGHSTSCSSSRFEEAFCIVAFSWYAKDEGILSPKIMNHLCCVHVFFCTVYSPAPVPTKVSFTLCAVESQVPLRLLIWTDACQHQQKVLGTGKKMSFCSFLQIKD